MITAVIKTGATSDSLVDLLCTTFIVGGLELDYRYVSALSQAILGCQRPISYELNEKNGRRMGSSTCLAESVIAIFWPS